MKIKTLKFNENRWFSFANSFLAGRGINPTEINQENLTISYPDIRQNENITFTLIKQFHAMVLEPEKKTRILTIAEMRKMKANDTVMIAEDLTWGDRIYKAGTFLSFWGIGHNMAVFFTGDRKKFVTTKDFLIYE